MLAMILMKLTGVVKQLPAIIAKWWKVIIVGGMVLIIMYQNFSATEWLKFVGIRTIPSIQQEVIQCTTAKQTLEAHISKTNEQIKTWADTSADLMQQYNVLASTLTNLKQATDKRINGIMREQVPVSCENIVNYLRTSATTELAW